MTISQSVVFFALLLLTPSLGGCGKKVLWENLPTVRSSAFKGSDFAWLVTEREGVLIFTSDGGKTWTEIQGNAVGGKFDAAAFIDQKHGWAVNSEGRVWKSDDGGKSWIAISTLTASGGDDWHFNSAVQLEFVDDRHGWIIETLSIWRTDDGGVNWRQVFPSGFNARGKGQSTWGSFVGPNKAWISRTSGEVCETKDAAVSWQIQTVMPNGYFTNVYFLDEGTGWLVGYIGGETGTQLYRTDDGGKSWRKYLVSAVSIESVYFLDSNEGWAVGGEPSSKAAKGYTQGLLLHTRDGGQSWDRMELPFKERYLDRVQFTDEANGWLIGRNNIYRTGDRGKSWQAVLSLHAKDASRVLH